jgi:cyclopropane fatty-acyl-phospholipid synthase-like methyltransferase
MDKVAAEVLESPESDESVAAPSEDAGSEPVPAPEPEFEIATAPDAVEPPEEDAVAETADEAGGQADIRYKKVPLLSRLHAWWEGYDVVLEAEDPEPEETEPEPAPEPEREPDTYAVLDETNWSPQRAEAAEMVWGSGFVGPSGAKEILEMVKPMGLDPSKSILDLSAGLGESSRLVAQTFGTWVTGMEASPTLASQANEKSVMAGLSKKAPVKQYDPETLDLDGDSFDCIFAREAFFTVKAKAQLIETLVKALKTHGELAFTDLLLRAPELKSETLQRWRKGEPVMPYPWSVDEVVEALHGHHLDVRVNEDITETYRARVVKALEDLIASTRRRKGVKAQLGETLIAEAEMWARRVEAFDSGDLRVYRFLARKPELGNDIKGMSDW